MTFYRNFCNDGCCSTFGCEDLYGFGGLNGYRFGSPYGCYLDQYRYGSPYGYRSFGSLYGNRGLSGYSGLYGYENLYGLGNSYPFFSRFGSRYSC